VWQYQIGQLWDAGAFATSGGLVFSSTPRGHLPAFNPHSGKLLLTSPTVHSGIIATPISYRVTPRETAELSFTPSEAGASSQ
jgi:outer membrane protein assembly factor BamB